MSGSDNDSDPIATPAAHDAPEPSELELTHSNPQAPAPAPAPAAPAQAYPYSTPGAIVSNGMATTGGVLGIVGFVLSWIPLLGILVGLVIGILAIVFGSIGISRSGRLPGAVGRGMAITGLVLGILTVIFKLIPGVNLL